MPQNHVGSSVYNSMNEIVNYGPTETTALLGALRYLVRRQDILWHHGYTESEKNWWADGDVADEILRQIQQKLHLEQVDR